MSWKRPPARPSKQIDGDIAPRTPAPAIGLAKAMAQEPDIIRMPMIPRVPASLHAVEAKGRKIRQSARGKDCQVRYVGICTRDPAHTIWSHARWGAQVGVGGKGMGTKSDDLAGAYACAACDAAFDQMLRAGDYTRQELDLDWMMGHLRSLAILQRDGLV